MFENLKSYPNHATSRRIASWIIGGKKSAIEADSQGPTALATKSHVRIIEPEEAITLDCPNISVPSLASELIKMYDELEAKWNEEDTTATLQS